jgi:hypothetical protein
MRIPHCHHFFFCKKDQRVGPCQLLTGIHQSGHKGALLRYGYKVEDYLPIKTSHIIKRRKEQEEPPSITQKFKKERFNVKSQSELLMD